MHCRATVTTDNTRGRCTVHLNEEKVSESEVIHPDAEDGGRGPRAGEGIVVSPKSQPWTVMMGAQRSGHFLYFSDFPTLCTYSSFPYAVGWWPGLGTMVL